MITKKKDDRETAKTTTQPAAEEAQSEVPEEKADIEVAARPEVVEPWDWFGDWFGDWFDRWPPRFGRRLPEVFTRPTSPVEAIKVEQFTDDGHMVVRAEIPGLDPDKDIDVSVADGRLTIAATRERREETKTNGGFHSEFHYGSFRRSLALPPDTEPGDVEASYTDGILEVRVPIDHEAEAKTKVPITHTA